MFSKKLLLGITYIYLFNFVLYKYIINIETLWKNVKKLLRQWMLARKKKNRFLNYLESSRIESACPGYSDVKFILDERRTIDFKV